MNRENDGARVCIKGPVPLARPVGEKRKQACPRDNKGRIENEVGHRNGDWSFKGCASD